MREILRVLAVSILVVILDRVLDHWTKEPDEAEGPDPEIVNWPEIPETTDQAMEMLRNRDDRFIEESLKAAQRSYDDEDRRSASIESKGNTILSALAISSGAVIGVSSLLLNKLDDVKRMDGVALVLLVALYFMGTLLLLLAIARAMLTVKVRSVSYPSPQDVLALQDGSLGFLRRNQVANFLIGYRINKRTNDLKATHLIWGQIFLVGAAICLFLAGLAVVGVALVVRFL
jgi:hypothetical protein